MGHVFYNITSHNLLVPNFQLTQFKNSILYKGVDMWNNLPNNLKQIDTFSAFKDKTELLSKLSLYNLI